MPSYLIILFCVIPLTAGLLSVPLVNRPIASRVVGTLSFGSLVLLSIGYMIQITPDAAVLVTQMGGWPAPFGISLVFDSLSGLLIAAAATVALGSYIHSFSSLDPVVERRYFHPLIQLLIFGVNMSFLTGDLFNLFVAFEVMLMASYALLTLGSTRRQMSQAYKYVLLNLLASTVFVMAAGMAYGMMGTLNMADMARIVAEIRARGDGLPAGFYALGVVLLMVFGLKGAFFPLWFWLPDTYHTCPTAIAGLFGGLLTKVGVYAVARLFPLVFTQAPLGGGAGDAGRSWIIGILAVSAAFTMFLAVLGAVSQREIRRILAVHVISQVGYMVFALAVSSGVALAGCVIFMIHNMVVKCSLFLCCGIMEKHAGTDDLDKLGGLLKRDTLLGVLFFVAAMSLVGLPPLSGFFGKMVIIREGWHDFWWLSVLGLLTGALTLLSMLKIWSYGFWNPAEAPEAAPAPVVRRSMRAAYTGTAILVAASLFLGFGAEVVYQPALNAGRQLENPRAYVAAVLGADAATAFAPDNGPGAVRTARVGLDAGAPAVIAEATP